PEPAHAFVLGTDRPLYLSAHSRWSRTAPEGLVVVHAMAYLRPGTTVERDVVEGFVEAVQPGWRDAVVDARWLPRAVVSWRAPRVDATRPGVVVGDGVFRCGEHVG